MYSQLGGGKAQDRPQKKLIALPAFRMDPCMLLNWGHVTEGVGAGLCLCRLAYSSETKTDIGDVSALD